MTTVNFHLNLKIAHHWTVSPVEMDEPTEIDLLKQRLNDTHALYETLKNEVLLEREVSQELARRNDCLQRDLYGSEERMKEARLTAVGLESAVKSLSDQIGSNNYLVSHPTVFQLNTSQRTHLL